MEEKYQEKLLSLMREQGIDAMMIAPSEEMRFLAGFHVYQPVNC